MDFMRLMASSICQRSRYSSKTAEAENVYREDLKRNPENGWALYGLAQSLRAQKKTKETAAVEKRFRKAWARADVKLIASRF